MEKRHIVDIVGCASIAFSYSIYRIYKPTSDYMDVIYIFPFLFIISTMWRHLLKHS